jgi:hypothetical protein
VDGECSPLPDPWDGRVRWGVWWSSMLDMHTPPVVRNRRRYSLAMENFVGVLQHERA